MHTVTSAVLAAALTTALAPAQQPAQPQQPQPLTAESFMPESPQGEVLVDFARMREHDVWEAVESSLLKAPLRQLEKEAGCKLAGLDRMCMWIRYVEGDAHPHRITMLTGQVALPPSMQGEFWSVEKVGDHELRAHKYGEQVCVCTDRLLATGNRELIEPALRGETRGGRPGPDLMSLLSGRATGLLHVYADLLAAKGSHADFGFLGQIDYPEDDPATHMLLRVVTTGVDSEQQLALEATVRHRKGDAGLRATEAAGREWLAQLQKHPQLGALKRLWSAVVVEAKGTDLVARLDLGPPREAVGTLAMLLAPLFVVRQVEAAAVEVEAAAPAPATEPAKKDAPPPPAPAPVPAPAPAPVPLPGRGNG
jgi:hypothetical protein